MTNFEPKIVTITYNRPQTTAYPLSPQPSTLNPSPFTVNTIAGFNGPLADYWHEPRQGAEDTRYKEVSVSARAEARSDMYLISWNEEEARIEASLGGRITVAEMEVFAEELLDVIESMADRPHLVVLDQSRAKELDQEGAMALSEFKNIVLSNGDAKVVTIARNEVDALSQTSERLQFVLEGREEIVLESAAVVWQSESDQTIRRAA